MISRIFSTFSIILLGLGRDECSSSSTDSQLALKHEFNLKLPFSLKNVLQKPHKTFQAFQLRIYLASGKT
jgi:hypothetical protein